MVDFSAELYQNPQEVWDEKTCLKMSKRTKMDGMGTPYPQKGYLSLPSPHGYGKTRYNGGCNREGKWYQGENFPLPRIHEGFTLKQDSFGWRIIKL